MRTRVGPTAVFVAAAVLATADGAAAKTTTVPIRGLEFKRSTVTVNRGAAVVWKDRDSYVTHSVTSRGRDRFRSSPYLQSGDEHRVRFSRSGTYRYVCRVHSFMQGRIVVK